MISIYNLTSFEYFTVHRNKLKTIRLSCHSFFMEVVSTLCFGQSIPPEEELVKELFNLAVNKGSKKDFINFDNSSEVPIARYFLLKLLLEHK